MKLILKFVIRFYQVCISPYTKSACRYAPTCSEYALIALARYRFFVALKLIVKRLSKCHPWGGHGYDPVPDDLL